MKELDISELVSQESFLNYCLLKNKEDVAYWENWLKDNPAYKDHVEEIKTSLLLLHVPIAKKVIDHDFQILKVSIAKVRKDRSVITIVKLWPRIAGIAVSVAVIVSGVYFFNYRNKTIVKPSTYRANDISPGRNTARLTLSDGSVINLSDVKTGVIIHANELTYNDGTVVPQSKKGYSRYAKHDMLTAATPRGGTYQIILPDGTKVWLNAASSIKFPSKFSNKDRRVELAGEGYFEVVKDKKHPFIVISNGQEVEVLGTHFNINAYTDEMTTNTTLLEGSVRINQKKVLTPGQQASLSKTGELFVSTVEVTTAVAWTNGKFRFKEASLQTVLRQLARWYDVEIKYEGEIPDKKFSGGIDRNLNAAEALELLKFTNVNFKIKGRTITVIN